MSARISRREFIQAGALTTLSAGLAGCSGLARLLDLKLTMTEEARSQLPSLTTPQIDKPPLIAEASSTLTQQPVTSPSLVSTRARSQILPTVVTPTPIGMPIATPEPHEAMFYRQVEGDVVHCQVCFRNCKVKEGMRGFCRNKVNKAGRYFSIVYGQPSSLQIDPIEKEPHFHMLPGSYILCTGTASCNNRCIFCQNWHLSQRAFEEIDHWPISPEQTVEMAATMGCHSVSFTYNEPTVFYEHMFDTVKSAKQIGLGTLFHTNGGMQAEPLEVLLEYMDAVTVDLKAFTQDFYREVSSSELLPVMRTLDQINQSDAHLEIVNLVIPTLNDEMEDIRRMCAWIKMALGDKVPLHFTRFFPAYKLTSLPPTPIETLESAAQIADEEGIKYVYIGNVPGHERNNTFCPKCHQRIIERIHFTVLKIHLEDGKCGFCGHPIPGIWEPT